MIAGLRAAWGAMGRLERAGAAALAAFCALGPAVFAVKALVRPEGDVFPKPSAIPAVPVVLLTIGDLTPADLAGPRSKPPLPHLAAFLRDSLQFASSQSAGPQGLPALRAILRGAFAAEASPSLASALKRLGYATFAAVNTEAAAAEPLTDGFDAFERRAGEPAARLAERLDAFLGAEAPPRFFAWLDMGEARGAGGDARRAALLAADEAVGRVVECLRRRRIQADGLYILTSDPRTPPSGELPLRGVLGIQFPFEYRSGSVCPTAASAADLAPTIVETVRGTPQPAWRGRSRRADVQHFQSSGPAVAGPFPVGAGSAWVAEEGGQVLVATPEGAMIAYRGGGSPPERLASAVRAAVH